jgi:plastocyanin
MRRRLRRVPAAMVAIAVLAAGAGCGEDRRGSPGPEDLEIPIEIGAEVTVDTGGFEPAAVDVAAGEAVEFTISGDEDAVPPAEHRLIGDDGLFDTGVLYAGETFLYFFDEPGEYVVRDGRGDDAATLDVTVGPATTDG